MNKKNKKIPIPYAYIQKEEGVIYTLYFLFFLCHSF